MDRITTPPSVADVDRLAVQIADRGIEAVAARGGLDPVVRAAREAGVSANLVALVADAAAPAVVRERAFGRLAVQLATHRHAPRPLAAA